jgi:replication factor C subunit 2/4
MDNKLEIPWVEKYRPMTLDDLILDEHTMNKINKIVEDKNMPNIIITGIPGIGKTTTILCIAKLLLGKYFKDGVLELNASDDRGIKSVQDSIIYFCKKQLTIPESEIKYANHKIVLLDEADNMTTKAQQLINNLMGEYHKTTRFAFTCNNSSDIIEAIQSRCLIFRYKRLSEKQVIKRLETVCDMENITYDKEGLHTIMMISQGDMRQALNCLQTTYNGYTIISSENVYKICDKPHPLIINNMLIECHKKNIRDALIQLNKLRDKGYCSSDIIMGMFQTLKSSRVEGLDEDTKIKFMAEISRSYLVISKGVDSNLQLTGCLCKLVLL